MGDCYGTLLGLDIGYSEKRSSSGMLVAEVREGTLFAVDGPHNVTAADALSRAPSLFDRYPIRAVALDASVAATPQSAYRPVEMAFSRGQFQKHCKPGSTRSKVGQRLHAAGMEMMAALHGHAGYAAMVALVAPTGIPILEVFPSAALGVLLPLGCVSGVKRGMKSDALFDLLWREREGRIGCLRLDPTLQAVSDHDRRMAVIALLSPPCTSSAAAPSSATTRAGTSSCHISMTGFLSGGTH